MRIEIVEELAAASFRKEVARRLQALMDRLMKGKDIKSWKMVMMLIPALEMKGIPWGLCGLILEIYNRTMQRFIRENDEDQGVFRCCCRSVKSRREENIDVFTI